jgi:hypothetical protein
VGEDAELDLAVVGGQQPGPSAATNAERIRRPSSVRMGIDWRFGLVVDSRPVAATAWLIVVWRRPSRSSISPGSGSRYVLRSFVSSRHSSTTGTIGWSSRIERSTRASVE